MGTIWEDIGNTGYDLPDWVSTYRIRFSSCRIGFGKLILAHEILKFQFLKIISPSPSPISLFLLHNSTIT